ncbi:MAG: hypothetical protein RL591_2029 [Planctomycetota bacterium]
MTANSMDGGLEKDGGHERDGGVRRTAREAATEIARALIDAGFTAYFAGGCVRDALLGLEPKDYDIATSATPDEVKQVFPKARGVGEAFGVMLVRKASHTIEVATFREDLEYIDGRRPTGIRFADARADAERRDFTINGIFREPLTGAIVDFVEGERDLRAGIVRAIGDPHARIREDRLRMLRAARFASRLAFTIDPATVDAIRVHASELASVSPERVGDEVRRMLAHPNRAHAAQCMESLGLDAAVFGATARPHEWNRLAALPPKASAATALAAWWLDRGDGADVSGGGARAGAPLRDELRARLALSNTDCDQFSAVLDCRALLLGGPERHALPARVRLAARAGFDAAIEVLTGEHPAVAASWRAAAAKECPSRRLPAPMVDGNHLVRAGLRPSPAFKTILDTTLDRQICGAFSDENAALASALALAAELGAGPT